MHYNTLFVGMDVHKESFTLCCYDFSQDKVFYTQKMEADCMQILKYLDAVQSDVDGDVQFICGYEAGCPGFTLYHQLMQHGVKCIILAPTTMMKTAGKKTLKTDKLYHGGGTGASGDSWEFAVFVVAILSCNTDYCGADTAKSLQI